ncbi:MAG: ribose-phosphate pyrophosphokinase [Thermoguttaceae bacterium]|nr:ribose-phosphate pyrophosphokinase [Thermoguttaceae bacterium]
MYNYNLKPDMKIFSGRSNPDLATRMCDYLGVKLGKISIGNFPDGEIFCKIEEDVRGRDIFIVQSTGRDVNEALMELLIMIDSFRRASASRITAVIPYYGYARQDRKDEGRVPITAKLVANLLTKAGVDRVLSIDLHAAQIQGFFDIPVDHLHATPVLDEHIQKMNLPQDKLMVVSPDEGSIKRAQAHADNLNCPLAVVDKRRTSATETRQANLIGPSVEGKTVILFDDMISTAGSITGAAKMVKEAGAEKIYLCATHGVFCGDALNKLNNAPIDGLAVTNTIFIPEDQRPNNTVVVDVSAMLAEAVRRIHYNESVSMLFKSRY